MELVLVKTFRNSGLNASKLRAMALEMGPIVWDRYNQERRRVTLDAPHKPQPATWSDTGLHAAWLGHSSVLLKMDGVTLTLLPGGMPGVPGFKHSTTSPEFPKCPE